MDEDKHPSSSSSRSGLRPRKVLDNKKEKPSMKKKHSKLSADRETLDEVKLLSSDGDDVEQPKSRKVVVASKVNAAFDSDDNDADDETRILPEDEEHEDKATDILPPQNARKDLHNIALLMLLYFLQGIPIGLTGSLPFILSAKKVSYASQGTFSFAFWPFSLKLLWAPIVDSIFIRRLGRRKSWLVPIQYLIGLFMLVSSGYIEHLLSSTEGPSDSDIYLLTAIFFMFNFLAATQDIAVDGWALTMLRKENVSWGSTCNSAGQTAGWFVGNVVFLVIESADFSNQYLRPVFGLPDQKTGLVTIGKFMTFFGVVFTISTTLVLIFKKEIDHSIEPAAEPKKLTSKEKKNRKSVRKDSEASSNDDLTVTETYKVMWKILWLGPVKKLIIILMTVKIAFATDSMSFLKFIEAGVPREKLGLLAVPLTPLQIILPLVISRYTNGPKPFDFFIKAIPFRMLSGLGVTALVYYTPLFKDADGQYPFHYYVVCFVIDAIHSVFVYTMFVSQMSFFAQISDKAIGGTYMTFLNTISNLGGNWPSTSALYLASYLTFKFCSAPLSNLAGGVGVGVSNSTLNATVLEAITNNTCKNDAESKSCVGFGGVCVTQIDAYYVETAACTLFGIFWILWAKKIMYNLQSTPKSAWKVSKSK